MKQLLSYLTRRRALLGMSLGLLAGVGTSLVFVAIKEALSRTPHLSGRQFAWFACLCLATQACQLGSETLLFRQTEGLLLELRLRFARQIVEMPLRRQEQLGSARVLAAFSEDIPALVKPIRDIGQLANNLVMAGVCLAYLAMWSWQMVLGVTVFVVVGLGAVRALISSAEARVKAARGEQDRFLGHLRALTEGAKELKLHRSRRHALVADVLRASGEALARHNVALESRFAAASSWGNGLFFVLMGLIIWLSQYVKGLGGPGLGGFVLVVSFVVGPILGIFRMAPGFSRAAGALASVERLGLSLRERESEAPAAAVPAPPWRLLELRGVGHSFRGAGEEEGFVLGPLDLTLSPGEVVFLTGGNGSGKTTLAKLLTGLYAPDRGEIVLDGRLIGEAERSQYRERFAVVFFDFYLFDSLLGLDWRRLEGKTREYLHRFGLQDKVAVKDGKLSTLDLSQGQRRRLALLTAYLEERPICVFDEWASDQDAPFRETFYLDLLPELRAQGRTVVVISHDERYYHVADRIVRLEYGRLMETSHREEICLMPAGTGDGAAERPNRGPLSA
jgi:putative ATP-binding cassette transporter